MNELFINNSIYIQLIIIHNKRVRPLGLTGGLLICPTSMKQSATLFLLAFYTDFYLIFLAG